DRHGRGAHRGDRRAAPPRGAVRQRLRRDELPSDVKPPRHHPPVDAPPPHRRGSQLRREPKALALALAAACALAACSSPTTAGQSPAASDSPSPAASPSPSPSPPAPCVEAAAARHAPGVTSSNAVLLLSTGLNAPDDLMYVPADGTVLVGEHGNGHLARVGGAARLTRLPQVVLEAEGIAQIGSAVYIADQFHARIVALTASGVRTVLQLQPVPSGENLDGIGA